MTKLKFVSKYILVPVVTLIAGTSFVLAKPSIKALTSNKKSEEVARKMPRLGGDLKKHSVGLGIGQTFLKSDFEDNGDDQITWDLFYDYSASYSFDFIANFHSSTHKFKSRKVTITGLNFGIKAKLFQVDAFSPIAIAGLGFYQPSMTRVVNGELVASDKKVTFGYHFGAGGELKLNENVKVGLLGHFHNPFDIRQDIGSEIEGSYFKLMLLGFYTF